jgi:NAD-dependent SIR2 family protein deacetylase
LTGAGISVNSGIPDFRSENGLYNCLDRKEIDIPSAELLFDLKFFLIDAGLQSTLVFKPYPDMFILQNFQPLFINLPKF